MPRGLRSASESFPVRRSLSTSKPSSNSLATPRRRATGEAAFNPSNLVPHGIANDPAGIEIRISQPLNTVALFAHSADRWSGGGYDDGGAAVAADYENGTEGRDLPRTISFEVLAHERIALPVRLYGLRG